MSTTRFEARTMHLTDSLRFAVVSDIHLGHARNRAAEIIKNLLIAFPDDAVTAQLDIIFLAGDVFDDLLQLPDDDVVEIDVWIFRLLMLCKKHDIKLRVLEGTPRHDWKQSERFTTLNSAAELGVDLRYVKDLSIEYIAQYDINILYVPDEWEPTAEKTLEQVYGLLRGKGLTQVDFAIMHGQFEHQLPAFVKAPKHSNAAYLALVRELIFIGHVHKFSQSERIYAQGSFDRLAQGEEEPKGHLRVCVKAPGEHEVVFVENQGAKRFVTVHCVQMDLESAIEKIDYVVKDLPAGSYVRIKLHPQSPLLADTLTLVRMYPTFTIGYDVVDDKPELSDALVEDQVGSTFNSITLTKDNLGDLLLERMSKRSVESGVLQACAIILEEVL